MSSVLMLHLFGTFEVFCDDQALDGLHLREGERLLAYLTLRHNTAITYRQIAQQFWPSEAQQNLSYEGGDFPSTRQAVASLRRALGPHAARLTSVSKGVVRLDLEEAEVDLLRFEQLLQQEDPLAWRQAQALYRGPLLEGWPEKWAQEARVRCQTSYDRLTAKLAAYVAVPVTTTRAAPASVSSASIAPAFLSTLPPVSPLASPPASKLSLETPSETSSKPSSKLAAETSSETSVEALSDDPGNVVRLDAHDDTAAHEADGGAVPLDSPWYVVRATDAAFEQALRRGDSIVLVKGARQVGKTSLLARSLQQVRQAGACVVLSDFQKLNTAQFASLEALYLALASTLTLQLDLDVSPHKVWDADLGPNMNLEWFLRRHVLKAIRNPLVWGMDEVDRLFVCPFGSEVFGLFRSWHNERSLDPSSPWSRLTLAIAYATEASLFITDLNQSPFNVGTRLILDDFTLAQIGELNQRYGVLLSAEEVTRFHALVGGQPYLVRRGFSELRARQWHLPQLEAEADQEEGPFGDHLRRLLASLNRAPELTEVVRGLLAGQSCANAEHFYRLRTAGVLAGASSRDARFRCRLYALYLARHLG